jgi:vitellogenic carboxypeptidase-like protein
VLGFIQEARLLSWVKVLNAGHMAVMDQPLLINLILEKLLGAEEGGR